MWSWCFKAVRGNEIPLQSRSRCNPTLLPPCTSCSRSTLQRALVEAGVAGVWKDWRGMKHGEGTGQKTEGSMHVEWHLDTKAGIWDIAVTSARRFIRVTCCGTPYLTLHMHWNLASMRAAGAGRCNSVVGNEQHHISSSRNKEQWPPSVRRALPCLNNGTVRFHGADIVQQKCISPRALLSDTHPQPHSIPTHKIKPANVCVSVCDAPA